MLDPDYSVTVAEPAYCASCGLKHTRRPDWLCPRCGMPVGSEAPVARRRPAAPVEQGFPRGARIAGAMMALAGLALAVGFATAPAAGRWPLLATALLLAVLGLALLLAIPWSRWTALALAAAAAVLASEDLVRARLPGLFRDPLPAGVREVLGDLLRGPRPAQAFLVAGFLAGCLLLLAGRPRTLRAAAGALLAAPAVVLELVRVFAR